MAGRPSRTQALDIWMNGERVGTWSVSPREGHAFAYAAEWLANPRRRPISLSLPLSRETDPVRGEVVEAYFDNLLPDSRDIRTRLARRYGAGSVNAFQLLTAIGRDCVGAVQLLPAGSPPPAVRRIEARPLTAGGVAALLDRSLAAVPLVPAGEEDELRISLAGAQEKTALLLHDGQWQLPLGNTPTTHILKLPLGRVGTMQADFSTSVENEWLCSRILHAFGLPVAHCWMETFGPHKVLVVERFDRQRYPAWWARLPQEDFCQALGIPPGSKYESHGGPGIDAILDKLRGSQDAEADRRRFLTSQLIFWLLGAPDGHAKNFSIFLEPEGRFRLTPLYDVMSAWPVTGSGPNLFNRKKLKLAMAVCGKNRHALIDSIQRRHWNETAKRNAMGANFEAAIAEVLAAVPGVVDKVASELPPGFPAAVSRPMIEGLQEQARRLAAMPP
ncbi:MAG: type II toxin-antitoxin system HipA family toxin [Rhodocyclales bacterium]|nr:type II toxin-antitoxin system HipA family toxin [Rhodocyclales bacterium]